MNIIEAQNINKSFAGHKALQDVSVEIPQGSVYGIIGPNGAGKTTLIRILTHITAPDTGVVTFNGRPMLQSDTAYIGYMPEERGLYKKMKVSEQAIFFARLKGLSRRDATTQLKQWFERLEISSWWDKKVEELSKGMAQKVQFIITVLHQPKLLIFDEPFSGFDPINADILKREINRLHQQGATIIFSTHNMSSAEELCNRITLINKSRNILTGDVEELRRNYGKGKFEITYEGDGAQLKEALAPIVLSADDAMPETNSPYKKIIYELKSPELNRQAIQLANQSVDIKQFSPVLPTMERIFIDAVNQYNKTHE